MPLTACFYHVTYTFQNEFTLYICLNFKELLARNRDHVWSLSDSNGSWIHNHLACKQTLNHLAKLTKALRWVLSTDLCGAFCCMLLLRHLCISDRVHTLHLLQWQGTPCSKLARYLKFKWLQQHSNSKRRSLSRKTQPFNQTHQMIELSCEYLYVRCIWQYVIMMSRAHSRVNPQSIFSWVSGKSLLQTEAICEI